MLIKKHKVRVSSIVNPLEGVYTLEFESMNGKFKYAPGQFLHLALDADYDGSGQWPESRCFSMQTNPESSTIKITYAVKGTFTKDMANTLKVGSELWLKLPFGELFSQDHNKEKTVFIAGGTGVTPYLSLFTRSSFAEYKNPQIYLGFRSQSFHLYHDELAKACSINASGEKMLHIICQDTDGVLDIHKIYKENGNDACYFISGPPVMISSFKKTLLDLGVSELNIKTDDWE